MYQSLEEESDSSSLLILDLLTRSSQFSRLDTILSHPRNLETIVPRHKLSSSELLSVENHFGFLLGIIISGNFRALLLTHFRKLIANYPSMVIQVSALLESLYDFQHHRLPDAQGRNRNFKYPPLDLSSSGLPASFLSLLMKNLREHYCNPSQLPKDLHSQQASVGAYLQEIDLSSNQLTPTFPFLGLRQLYPSVCQRLAVWLVHPRCRLQSLNLSNNPELGGSTETFGPSIKRIGWGSDIFRIIMALLQNNSLEVIKMANTGINLIDFEVLAQMLGNNAALRVVDISQNPITQDGRPHLNTMLEKRYKNNRAALSLALGETGLLEPVALLRPKSLELAETKSLDPVDILEAENPLEAFRSELFLQLKYLNFRSVGRKIFSEYKPEKYPEELDYYFKLVHIILLIGGGAAALATPLGTLIGAITKAMGFAGIVHKIEELIQGLKDLFENLTPEDEKLFSFENLHLLYEASKDGIKAATKSGAQIQKLMELGKKLKSNTPAAKNALDTLHCKYEIIAKLFLEDKTLRTRIVKTFIHAYYDIIRRLNNEEAVRFAKGIGSTIESGLLSLALSTTLTVEETPDMLLQQLQLMTFDLFQTLKFRKCVHRGYVRQREKSFKDIFGITRTEALKAIMDHPQQEDFKEIELSLSELLISRGPGAYGIPAEPRRDLRIARTGLFEASKEALKDLDCRFTLTELLAIHRDPSKTSSVKRRQLAAFFFRMQAGEEEECCWHPALLQALARLRGFTLFVWQYDPEGKGILVPFYELSCARYEHPKSTKRIDCVDESEVKNSQDGSQITVAIKFSPVIFDGYESLPDKHALLIPRLNHDQLRMNESSVVWARDLLQRPGLVCTGADNAQICFDISKKVPSQAGKVWTQTDFAQFGC